MLGIKKKHHFPVQVVELAEMVLPHWRLTNSKTKMQIFSHPRCSGRRYSQPLILPHTRVVKGKQRDKSPGSALLRCDLYREGAWKDLHFLRISIFLFSGKLLPWEVFRVTKNAFAWTRKKAWVCQGVQISSCHPGCARITNPTGFDPAWTEQDSNNALNWTNPLH